MDKKISIYVKDNAKNLFKLVFLHLKIIFLIIGKFIHILFQTKCVELVYTDGRQHNYCLDNGQKYDGRGEEEEGAV